jgi:hypothetical protein
MTSSSFFVGYESAVFRSCYGLAGSSTFAVLESSLALGIY